MAGRGHGGSKIHLSLLHLKHGSHSSAHSCATHSVRSQSLCESSSSQPPLTFGKDDSCKEPDGVTTRRHHSQDSVSTEVVTCRDIAWKWCIWDCTSLISPGGLNFHMISRPQALHVAASRRTTGVCTTFKEARRTVGLPGQSPTPHAVAPARAVPGGEHTCNGLPCSPEFICILSPTRKKRVSDAFASPMKGWCLYVRPSSGSAKKALKSISENSCAEIGPGVTLLSTLSISSCPAAESHQPHVHPKQPLDGHRRKTRGADGIHLPCTNQPWVLHSAGPGHPFPTRGRSMSLGGAQGQHRTVQSPKTGKFTI